MIAKLQTISYLKNALAYCDRGGQLLDSHKCLGTSNDILHQMNINNAFNDRCIKKSFHIKIRAAPEDRGILNTQDWLDISKKYAEKIGYAKNPYAVYIHEEGSDKEHIHIVASRIKENNTAVDNNFTHYKNMDFCRDMEKEYDLRRVKRRLEKLRNNELFISYDSRLRPLKEKIDQAVELSASLSEMEQRLNQENISIKIGRGISFTDENGVSFKGSQIDRNFSLNGLKNAFENKIEKPRQIRM